MREIRFRGLQTYGQKWVYGYLVIFGVENRIYYGPKDNDYSIVYGASVGQFTGLTDKNGKEIYEGDILAFTRIKNFKEELVHPFEVIWYEENAGWVQFSPKNKVEIIGNIHQNPELLKNHQ